MKNYKTKNLTVAPDHWSFPRRREFSDQLGLGEYLFRDLIKLVTQIGGR